MFRNLTIAMGLALLVTPALGYGTPVIEDQTPTAIAPAANSVIDISAYGENIAPDDGNHPDYTQYWHILVRSVSPAGQVGPWTLCIRANGCLLTGFNSEVMDLEIFSRNWANQSGSQFQMRYYTGLDASNATDPSVNTYHQTLSGWSNIVTWQVRTPVAAAPPPPPKPAVMKARSITIIKVPEAPTLHVAPNMKAAPLAVRPSIPPR